MVILLTFFHVELAGAGRLGVGATSRDWFTAVDQEYMVILLTFFHVELAGAGRLGVGATSRDWFTAVDQDCMVKLLTFFHVVLRQTFLSFFFFFFFFFCFFKLYQLFTINYVKSWSCSIIISTCMNEIPLAYRGKQKTKKKKVYTIIQVYKLSITRNTRICGVLNQTSITVFRSLYIFLLRFFPPTV